MSKVKIELNREGVRSLLKSQEMQGIVNELATDIAARASGSYDVNVHVGRNRCNASVYTNDRKTIQDNLKNNTLLKSLGG